MRIAKYEIYASKGQWYWRLKGGNGEIVASGEGYTRKASAIRGAETVRSLSRYALIKVI